MDKNRIFEFLKDSPGIDDVEEINYKPEFLVLRFYYAFDEDEINAAREYSSDKSEDEEKRYTEYYLPYLSDIAVDETRDSIEELVDETGIDVEYINYELGKDDDACEFIAVFADEGMEIDIDRVLGELDL